MNWPTTRQFPVVRPSKTQNKLFNCFEKPRFPVGGNEAFLFSEHSIYWSETYYQFFRSLKIKLKTLFVLKKIPLLLSSSYFMRTLLYIFTLLLVSCSQRKADNSEVVRSDTTKSPKEIKIELPATKSARAKYHTDKDTVYIYSQLKDTLKFSKQDFTDIIDNFPELTSSNITSPDSTYGNSKIWVDLIDKSGNENHLSFGSEGGQDEYYILYAYFLKQKNGMAKYSVRRKKLHEIYNTLNSLFGALNYGGTYFSHQYSRIEGYAEFSVYWFRHYEDYFNKPYDIIKQKELYVAELRQLIIDEVKIDANINSEKEKKERCKDLFKLVDSLNKEITDNFYLRMAKSFQSDHY